MRVREWESARHLIAHLHDDVDAINLPDCDCGCVVVVVVVDSVAFCASAAVDNVVVVVGAVAVAARCAR